MKKIINSVFILVLISNIAYAQSNWTHVGPTKTVSSGAYENGRLDVIVPYPNYDGTVNKIIYAASITGGLWKTTDDGISWINISTIPMHFSGISDFAIDATGTGYLYISDINRLNYHVAQSNGVYKYSIGSNSWITQGVFPASPLLSTGTKLRIHHVKIHPIDNQIVFACTNVGIYRTINGGTSWNLVDYSSEFENIAFVPTTIGFNIYATGDNKKFKVSGNDGLSFSDETWSNPVAFAYDNIKFDLAYAYDNISNTHIIYLFGWATDPSAFTIDYPYSALTANRAYVLYKFTINSGLKELNYIMNYTDSDPTPDRFAVWGDKDIVYLGGDGLRKFNFSLASYGFYVPNNGADVFKPLGSSPDYGNNYWASPPPPDIHPDIHDIKEYNNGIIKKIFLATDGGFYVNDYNTSPGNGKYINNWIAKNDGQDISQIWGFSSSETEPDFYATGEADTKGFLFTASNMSSCVHASVTVEPISAYIDKRNADNIFFNFSQGSADAYVSIDHGSYFTYTSYNGVIPGSIFMPNSTNIITTGLATNHFFQDINRDDKIYMGGSGLWQYSPLTHSFGCKYRTGIFFSNVTDPLLRDSWGTAIVGIAVSPINENKFYMAGSNIYDPNSTTNHAAQVYSFTGGPGGTIDINDSWLDHNENSWSLITPDLRNVIPGGTTLTDNQIYQVKFPCIAISDLDPDKIWIGLSPVPNLPQAKILKRENGIWTDYSLNIPADEEVISMVHERGINDGIYVGTNRAVYYRKVLMTTSGWKLYSNNLPHLFMVQLDINYAENTLRAGTFGRGIWKTSLYCPDVPKIVTNCTNCNSSSYYNWQGTSVQLNNTILNADKLFIRGVDFIDLLPGSSHSLLDPNGNNNNFYNLFIQG